MMVPSRSTKMAGDAPSVMFAVLPETGDKFVSGDGRCSKFADYNSASMVGNLRCFNRSRFAGQSEGDEKISCLPFFKQRFTGPPKIDVFGRSFIWIPPRNA